MGRLEFYERSYRISPLIWCERIAKRLRPIEFCGGIALISNMTGFWLVLSVLSQVRCNNTVMQMTAKTAKDVNSQLGYSGESPYDHPQEICMGGNFAHSGVRYNTAGRCPAFTSWDSGIARLGFFFY